VAHPALALPHDPARACRQAFGELHVLKDINLEVATGQVVVVLGRPARVSRPLCRAINRLEPVDAALSSGRPAVPGEGKQLAQLRAETSAWCSEVSPFRAQDDSWKTSPSPRECAQAPQGGRREARLELLERVGIANPETYQRPQLSGGQAAAAAIARALAMAAQG